MLIAYHLVTGVDDYSGNYCGWYPDQIQTLYFLRQHHQSTWHFTMANYRRKRTEEYWYLPSRNCTWTFGLSSPRVLTVMQEWTDGCVAQYKSCNCMDDLSFSVADFGFLTVRNYFRTSHAKGLQDGAGTNLQQKAEMAAIRHQIVI